MILPVTLMTAGAAAFINIWLSIRIGKLRGEHKISIGDGGNEALIAAMRAQANFVENAPFVLILMGLIELAWGPSWWLWSIASLFLLGRVAHGIGMTSGKGPWRIIGTLTTMLILLGLALLAVAIPYVTPSGGTITEVIPASS